MTNMGNEPTATANLGTELTPERVREIIHSIQGLLDQEKADGCGLHYVRFPNWARDLRPTGSLTFLIASGETTLRTFVEVHLEIWGMARGSAKPSLQREFYINLDPVTGLPDSFLVKGPDPKSMGDGVQSTGVGTIIREPRGNGDMEPIQLASREFRDAYQMAGVFLRSVLDTLRVGRGADFTKGSFRCEIHDREGWWLSGKG